VRRTAERFGRERLQAQARTHEAERSLPAALLDEARAIGFATLSWPTAHGGAGLGAMAKVVALAELAAADPAAALAIDAAGPVGNALLAFDAGSLLDQHLTP